MEHIVEYTGREIMEIHLALVYASHFRHGTAGHNGYMVLAKVALHLGFELDAEDKIMLPPTVRQIPTPV